MLDHILMAALITSSQHLETKILKIHICIPTELDIKFLVCKSCITYKETTSPNKSISGFLYTTAVKAIWDKYITARKTIDTGGKFISRTKSQETVHWWKRVKKDPEYWGEETGRSRYWIQAVTVTCRSTAPSLIKTLSV